jgi:selenocysteine-specific elongation factor
MIVGTAGHIDHGKTALVRALTGVDTDRLPEEKRRGITIDLGFAPLTLPNVGVAGVVDVPGHEAFVRTMLAGATGIDLALLVIAADEGVMPQTREHVAILGLLGIRGGVVALTKSDLVEDDWLDLVRLDVADLLAGTAMADAPMVATSVVTGAGLPELRQALATAAAGVAPRQDDDLFRMPIDRVFTIRGTGTVVTGTVWSGSVGRDDVVRVMPDDRTVRVRALQAHGAAIERAKPGTRLAVALAGIDHDALTRGAVLVSDGGWHPSRVLRADVTLLGNTIASLSPRAAVRFHLGTTEVGARVVTPGGPLSAGETKPGRIVLDAPVVARAGDRFVIRGGSPVGTLGGGVVVDPHPVHRRARPWTAQHDSLDARLSLALREAGGEGLGVAELSVRLGASPSDVSSCLERRPDDVLRIGTRVFDRAYRDDLVASLDEAVTRHHQRNPLDTGILLQTIRARIVGRPELLDDAVRTAVAGGQIEIIENGLVRRTGWKPTLSNDQTDLKATLAGALRTAGAEPPSLGELSAAHGPSVVPIVRMLEREGTVVPVESDRYYDAGALTTLVDRLRNGMVAGREYTPSELREVIGLSRKYLIPFLEYCDRRGITERRSTGRVLHGT